MRKVFIIGCLSVISLAVSSQKKVVKTVKKTPIKVTPKIVVTASPIQSPLKLWYDAPAQYFEESLVLGNGQQGATVFGGISTDKIYLNDLTLWSGEPVDPYMNANAYKNLPAVREALAEKNYKKFLMRYLILVQF